MSEQNEWLVKYEQERKSRNELLKETGTKNKAEILAALRGIEATRVVATYSGAGDSGQIDGVEVYKGETRIDDLPAIKFISIDGTYFDGKFNNKAKEQEKPLDEAIEELIYDSLEMHHAGWEINDGSSGELTIMVEDGAFMLAHNEYYTESRQYDTEL